MDPSGNICLASYHGQRVDKFSPSGALLWSVDPRGGNPTGLFSVGSGASFQVVVSLVQDTAGSLVLDQATGSATGSFPLVDNDFVSPEADGNLRYSANVYVETVSLSGRVLSTFGGALDFGGWGFALVGSTFYYHSGPPFSSGGDAISSFSLSDLHAIRPPSNTLGWGAGLATAVTGNYFAPGSTPSVVATFDPWWAAPAAHLRLSYSVEDTTSLAAGTVPVPTEVPLPTTAAGLASLPLALPLADTLPGPYQVRATLYDTSTSPPRRSCTPSMPMPARATATGR